MLTTFCALFVSLAVLGPGLVLAYVLRTFLPHLSSAASLASVAAAGSVVIAILLFFLLRRRPRASHWFALVAFVLLGALPFSWLVWPARITHARFGLTVYGILPVPTLDLVIHGNGLPWFRVKSLRVTREEVESFLGSGDTDVVIGTGWDQRVKVDPDVLLVPGANVHVLCTPDAIHFYQALRADGHRVLLILHSTR